jgi:hypothetical protein
LTLAYLSDGWIWLQPIDGGQARPLVRVKAISARSWLIFSPDGATIAYADVGVHVVNVQTGETRRLLADVPFDQKRPNPETTVTYWPERFVADPDTGLHTRLVVGISIWEKTSVGVVDIDSGAVTDLRELDLSLLLFLQDSSVLLYGNNRQRGASSVLQADSVVGRGEWDVLIRFGDLTDETLYAGQAVEFRPGWVRLVGSVAVEWGERQKYFVLDFDAATGEAYPLRYFYHVNDIGAFQGEISPDGALIPVYLDTFWHSGARGGSVLLVDLKTGQTLPMELPRRIQRLTWLP